LGGGASTLIMTSGWNEIQVVVNWEIAKEDITEDVGRLKQGGLDQVAV
jgi:hypothetical protein